MNHFLAQYPRLCKFIFGALYFAASICLVKYMVANHWGSPILVTLTTLIAFNVLFYFCFYSLINPNPERKDLQWDYKVMQRSRWNPGETSLDDFVSCITNGRKFIRIMIIVGMVILDFLVLRNLAKTYLL